MNVPFHNKKDVKQKGTYLCKQNYLTLKIVFPREKKYSQYLHLLKLKSDPKNI